MDEKSMNCQTKECKNEAVGAVQLNVPAMRMPIAGHDPVVMVLNLCLCGPCFEKVKAADFIGDDLKKIVRIQTKGKATPDFDRAFVTQLGFDSQEWKILTQARRPGNNN